MSRTDSHLIGEGDRLPVDNTYVELPPENRIVFAELPRCPRCGSTDAKTTRSEKGGDGSKTHRKRCQVCNLAFQVCWE